MKEKRKNILGVKKKRRRKAKKDILLMKTAILRVKNLIVTALNQVIQTVIHLEVNLTVHHQTVKKKGRGENISLFQRRERAENTRGVAVAPNPTKNK